MTISGDVRPARIVIQPSALPAIWCKLASAAMLACMFALIKKVGSDYPTGQIVFARSFFAMIPVLWLVRGLGGFRLLRTQRPGAHIWRSIAGLSSLFLSFSAVSMLPLGLATALGYTAPLFITLLAFPLLGEKITRRRLGATAIGFVGMLLLVHPDTGSVSPGIIVALAGAMATALALISIRKMADTEADAAIVFYFTAIGTVVGAATLPFSAVMPSLGDLSVLVLIGLLGGGAQILLTKAYSTAPASLIAPFEYATLIFALILGLAVWDEFPAVLEMSGIFIIVSSTLFLMLMERRQSNTPQPHSLLRLAGKTGLIRSRISDLLGQAGSAHPMSSATGAEKEERSPTQHGTSAELCDGAIGSLEHPASVATKPAIVGRTS